MKRILYLLPILFPVLLLSSCDDGKDDNRNGGETSDISSDYFLTLNEGNFRSNNTTMTLFDYQTNTATQEAFAASNGSGLGDTGNDMKLYKGNIYVVMNTAGYIAVINPRNRKLIKSIKTLTEDGKSRQPRNITFHENKAYVSCFDGYVLRIDLTTLQEDGKVKVGRNPEGLEVVNGKLYVANSGGLDYNKPIGRDKTVSVVDLRTFTETKQITIDINPYMVVGYQDRYVLVNTRGDYTAAHPYKLYKIDCFTDEVALLYNDIHPLNIALVENELFYYSYHYTTETASYGKVDLETNSITDRLPLFDSISAYVTLPYDLTFDRKHGLFFVGDAKNYVISGEYFGFKPDGTLVYRFKTGINPNSIIYIP